MSTPGLGDFGLKNRSLYPDILFHFTGKEALFGILASNFQISYANEKIIGADNEREMGVPMVSFCDLRLSEVESHMGKYGSYGIGLTKKWANRNGLNPVFYISRYSPFTDGLLQALDKIYASIRRTESERAGSKDNSLDMDIFNIYRYVKNYEASLDRQGKKKIERYR